ncbi:hypothetical protein I6N90_02865 [Paenibacillus sp. GSMTC-2017]|uniref:hypothetical protein n=1 Tax=Paenibacillus sp. GSMTC-2017 TaxID=2794350 RepID=UPI0018D8AFF2|nr:hypothetical protein [Paenibacillus sp. GSMTC-2017]MBH5316751.1 hypothetical protein [Paenibacillus sp. GSMTC-2017]
MSDSVKTTLWILLYAMLAGISLALFAEIAQIHKYLFSLLAIYIGIRFFRRFETVGLRATFIVLAIVVYFLTAVCFAVFHYAQNNSDLVTSLI